MATAVLVIGLTVAAVLLALLLTTVLSTNFRIWPTPGAGTWQSYVFWPLFRGLNVLCFLMAALDTGGYFGLPTWLRAIALLALVASTMLFVYAFRVLGRDNSYGAQDGLVTKGIYRWSRNPQNAVLIVVYGCLMVATDGGGTYLLCAAMMAVYALMVFCEEPWLEKTYGSSFHHYCRRVPRFFNWRRALMFLKVTAMRCAGSKVGMVSRRH
jgi:protein-S-isoprenylcysteine O-methyltransferase Ste14